MSEAIHVTKTRIAPTPSGYLHLGNAYSFALTAALAKKYGANILLRIDDLDALRIRPEYVQDIFDTLQFLDIPWQEGPRNMQEYRQHYSQAFRIHLYTQALQQLQQAGVLFACNCSRTQVLQNNEAGAYTGTCINKNLPFNGNAWRLNTTGIQPLTIKTIENETIHASLPADMQHFVVKRKDGSPAYQLASLIDDLYFNVDFVVRGADLWPSTLAQLYLAQVLQQPAFTNARFHHHTLFSAEDGSKLSKSAGSTSIQYLRKQGYTAEDVYTLIGQMAGVGPLQSWQNIPV